MGDTARAAFKVASATAAWAACHSLLACTASKAAAERVLGARARNRVYRAGYNAVAAVTFGILITFIRRQPARTLYHVRGLAASAMRLGQLAALAYACWGVLQVGLGGMSGMPNLLAWLSGTRQIPREPEGQTPPPDRVSVDPGAVRVSPFARTRQALNFFLVPVLWLNPRMTTRLASFNAVSTLYLYFGSAHSERRLRRAYGRAYDQAYRDRGVPFFLPRFGAQRVAGPNLWRYGDRVGARSGARPDVVRRS